jgi:carbonic anhydrase/acetyltransferase-like protein (isoleucine patch superfamily)
MPLYALGDKQPVIDPSAYIHPDAVVIGDVTVGPESSIWPGTVLRGDRGRIHIGAQTSVQDGSVVHCTSQHDTFIGDRCVIGHNAHLEGCTVFDDSLIGSGAVVLHRVRIGPGSLVAASALVPNDKVVPPGARAIGVPARIVPDGVLPELITHAVQMYVANAHWYQAELRRIDDGA